jgi:integrase
MVNRSHNVLIIHDIIKKRLSGTETEFPITSTNCAGRLMARLLALPKTNEYIFGNGNLNAFRWKYDRQKHALSIKLQNPRLKEIRFHSLKHFKATKEYAITRNILHVKEILGHRKINSTLVYTHLVPTDDEAEHYNKASAKDEKKPAN